MDNLLLPSEETSNWKLQDWRWDPFKMEAEPVTSERTRPSRGRATRGPVVCQVEGCGTDLSGLKEYHQRYKICEYHLKVSSIVKDGVQQRFCQQCGRFHVLSEFDGVKRSCRARLERHNARRRKKSEGQNKRLATSTVTSTPAIKEESKAPDSGDSQYDVEMGQYEVEDMLVSQAMAGGPLFPKVSSTDLAPQSQSLDPRAMEGAANRDAFLQLDQIFYDTGDLGQGGSSGASDAMQPEAGQREEADPIAEVFRNFAQSEEARELWQAMQSRDMGHPESQQHPPAPQQAHPNPGQLAPGVFPSSEQVLPGRPVLEPIPMLSARSSGFRPPPGTDVGQSADVRTMCDTNISNVLAQLRGGLGGPDEPVGALVSVPEAPVAGSIAQDLLDEGGTFALYDSLLKLTSLSVKVFNCTPANLPAALRRELLNAVRGGLVPEGYMRPGCVQLTLDVRQERGETPKLLEVVQRLLDSACGDFWKTHHMLFQLDDTAVIVKDGEIIQTVDCASHPELFPMVQSARPICIANRPGEKFKLSGQRISGLQDMVHFRIGGRYLPMDVAYDCSSALDENEEVECIVLEDCPIGTLRVEAAHQGVMTSRAVPVLSLQDERMVEEIRELEEDRMEESELQRFLLDMGMVVEFREWVLEKHGRKDCVSSKESVARDYSTNEMIMVVETARRLLGYACRRGWSAVAECLLPVAMLGVDLRGSFMEAANAVQAKGWNICHLAVQSGKLEVVRVLQRWAAEFGLKWSIDAHGPCGESCLHLAACLKDRGVMAKFLIGEEVRNTELWYRGRDDAGVSPSEMARRSGDPQLDAAVREHCLRIERQSLHSVIEQTGFEKDSRSELTVATISNPLVSSGAVEDSVAEPKPEWSALSFENFAAFFRDFWSDSPLHERRECCKRCSEICGKENRATCESAGDSKFGSWAGMGRNRRQKVVTCPLFLPGNL